MEENSLKKLFWLLTNVFLVVLILFLICGALSLRRWSNSFTPTRTVTVEGEGAVVLVPNLATVSFSVVSEGKDVVMLQKDNNAKINRAIDFLKKLDIKELDIKTTGYNLYPRYEYDENARRSFISGYSLTQTVEVKIRDLNKVANVLGNLPALGINQISGPSFTVEDEDNYLLEARREAFAKAHARARELARLNGVSLGRVVNFQELGGGFVPIYARALGGDFAEGVSLPKIEPGSEENKVRVSVTFEIY